MAGLLGPTEKTALQASLTCRPLYFTKRRRLGELYIYIHMDMRSLDLFMWEIFLYPYLGSLAQVLGFLTKRPCSRKSVDTSPVKKSKPQLRFVKIDHYFEQKCYLQNRDILEENYVRAIKQRFHQGGQVVSQEQISFSQ